MKKTVKKILCLVLALMMAVPLAAFSVNAASAYKTYDEVDVGELLYAVNFNGTSGFYSPADGRNSDWNKTNASISADGRAVTVQYTATCPNGNAASMQRARFCGEIKSYKVNGKAYTVEFTVDSTVPVGVHFDGHTGFIINPAENKTWIGQSDTMDKLAGGEVYDGTGASEQTYAIELEGGTTLVKKGNGNYNIYPAVVYKLYVKQANNTWKLVREVADDRLNYFDWEKDYEHFYLSINRYKATANWNKEAGDSDTTSTVSNMNIYKGIGFLDLYVSDTPEVEDVKIEKIDIYAQNGSGNAVDWGSDNGYNLALDGILHEENFSSARNDKNELTKRVYFTESGEIAYKEDASFYGVIVAELNTLADISRFTIWSPNSIGGGWLDNAAYDIYYSVDGVSFAPVKGAVYDDAISAHKNVELSEFPGTATSGNSTGKIYRNDVDMTGITAKYIAIAVRDTIPEKYDEKTPNQDRMQIVLYELTVDAAAATEDMLNMVNGASVRLDSPTGLRFTGLVNKDYFDGLKSQYGEDNVAIGMLITPKDYLVDNGLEFTKEALDACDAISGKKYLEIDAVTVLEDGGNYKVNCAIVNINENNYDRYFSAILYVKVNGEIVEYSDFNEVFNSRSVSYVATKAYSDLASEQSEEYNNEVVVGDVTKYSPYTEEQRKILEAFFQ